jgi:hypothetical protein
MIAYLDASALVKRYIAETGSGAWQGLRFDERCAQLMPAGREAVAGADVVAILTIGRPQEARTDGCSPAGTMGFGRRICATRSA